MVVFQNRPTVRALGTREGVEEIVYRGPHIKPPPPKYPPLWYIAIYWEYLVLLKVVGGFNIRGGGLQGSLSAISWSCAGACTVSGSGSKFPGLQVDSDSKELRMLLIWWIYPDPPYVWQSPRKLKHRVDPKISGVTLQ